MVLPKHITCPLCRKEYEFLGSPAYCNCGHNLFADKMALRVLYTYLRKDAQKRKKENGDK